MTCIVGYVDNDKIYMGADSAGSNGYSYQIREDKKVFINKNMIFGFTSSFRMGQLLQYSLNIPDHDPRDSDFKYLCTTFMDSVIDCFKSKGFASIKDGEVSGGNFLLGYKGNLYEIQSDYQVGKVMEPFASVGCGEDYAKGALYALKNNTDLTPKQKILLALDAAQANSTGVKGPFNVLLLEAV